MTYCLGMLLRDGLVMMADTRTNAGMDNFSSYKKLHVLADSPGRQIFACTSGSLSISQSVIGLINEGLPSTDGPELPRTLRHATSMFRAAQLVGEAVQIANQTVGAALAAINLNSNASLLLGGRIGDGPPSLFLVYAAGNFIECKTEAPYLQIGETKYGKPILDRGLDFETPIAEAMKVGFLSFDSAMRSNLGVARPIDLMAMPRDTARTVLTRRIESDDDYFNDLSLKWAVMLHNAIRDIPDPPFMTGETH